MSNLRRVATAIYETGCADDVLAALAVLLTAAIADPDTTKGGEQHDQH